MHSQIESIPPDQWLEDVDQDGHPVSLARIAYRPVTWQKPRTYVISRRLKDLRGQQVLWDGEKYKYFAYVTNYRGGLVDQFTFCVERCSLEGFIKEGKAGFHYDALPCRELNANMAYLAHVQMAYNLVIWWKLINTGRAVNRWTIQTLRTRLFNICGNLLKEGGKWVLSLPELWPWRPIFEEILAVVRPMPARAVATG